RWRLKSTGRVMISIQVISAARFTIPYKFCVRSCRSCTTGVGVLPFPAFTVELSIQQNQNGAISPGPDHRTRRYFTKLAPPPLGARKAILSTNVLPCVHRSLSLVCAAVTAVKDLRASFLLLRPRN